MKQLQADSLYELKTVTSPQFSADGETVVSVVTSINQEKNEYNAHLYANKVGSNEPALPLTFGDSKNTMPKWASVGEKLAFLSNRSGKMQLYVKEGLAEAKQVTDENNGITTFCWSPDGEKLAYAAFYKEEDKEEETSFPKPVRIEKMKYKSDSRGLHDTSVLRVAVANLDTDEKKWLTETEYDVQLLGFSADSTAVLVAGDRSENRDFSFSADVWFIELESKKETAVTKEPIAVAGAAVSPKGNYVVLLGHYREFENATLPSLYLFDLNKNTKSLLYGGNDDYIGDVAIGDFLQNTIANVLTFNEDETAVYALVSKEGSVNVWSFNLDGTAEQHSDTSGHINGFTLHQKNLYVTYSDSVKPSELYHLSNGDLKPKTAFNQTIEDTFQLNKPEAIKLERADGTRVEGWLMKPNQFKEGETFPLVLEVHGGPHAMYAHTYFHEFQVLTAKGYGVLYTNPRGSHGYGQAFVDAVRGDYGGGDFDDLMDVLDYAIETNAWIDQDRVGITGGSYGGFMTNWAVGHTNRFKAAVTQRSISNWISFHGVSDIGYYFSEWQIKADLDDMETLWKHSPLRYVDAVETPLLILHGENDLRCPIEQAEQLFIELKKRRKTTEFIRFPQANHELSRSGKPNLRIERLNAISKWFDRYL